MITDPERRRRLGREAALRWRNRNLEKARASYRQFHEAWKLRDPIGYRAAKWLQNLKRKGLTRQKFELMLSSQSCRCAICGSPFDDETKPHIDHDHTCCPQNEACPACVRGLLCHHCNMGLGRFRDSPALLIKAAEYLESFKS